MWKKVDLHVHTPASFCHLDHVEVEKARETRPADIVRAALSKGLDGIAITDHNSVAFIPEIEEEGRKHGLSVLPGVEISARGGHLLAFFSHYQPPSFWEQFLYSIGLGRDAQGKGSYESDLWLDQVARQVCEVEGLAIAAHIDRKPRGFANSDDVSLEEKRRLLACPYFAAVEITIGHNKKSWNEGAMPGFSFPVACVQGSDAHSIEEIGRRPMYLDVTQFNLGKFQKALKDFRTRVRFPDEMESGEKLEVGREKS